MNLKTIKILTISLSLLVLAGCTTTTDGSTGITAADVAKHNTAADCWMIISGKVYDVTSYIDGHPGGEIIATGCGKDATQLFATQGGRGTGHSDLAESVLKTFYKADLAQ